MLRERSNHEPLSEFLRYLASRSPAEERLPSLAELSQELGISVATLREQLEVARALGVVDVRPKTGIRKLPYTFKPAVRSSLQYAVAAAPANFGAFADLRQHIEQAYWYEAVSLLTSQDMDGLRLLVRKAQEKLGGTPVQIPHQEHRELHLRIYQRLNNPFVSGMLETYWELYEAVGLDVFADFNYLQNVWHYHEKMVEAIGMGDFNAGYHAMIDHMNLLQQRSKTVSRQNFE
jgi:DNA-binding FadR family transcriptional regulator